MSESDWIHRQSCQKYNITDRYLGEQFLGSVSTGSISRFYLCTSIGREDTMPHNRKNPETGGNGVRAHLEQLGDASGCTEAWIQLSKYRRSDEESGGGS